MEKELTLKGIMASNPRWPYAYALGYFHGRVDKRDNNPCEFPPQARINAKDDYAKGYIKGWNDRGYDREEFDRYWDK